MFGIKHLNSLNSYINKIKASKLMRIIFTPISYENRKNPRPVRLKMFL